MFTLDLFQLPLTLRFIRPGHLLWTLFMMDDVSSNWILSFSSATKYCIFCAEIVLYLNKQCIPCFLVPYSFTGCDLRVGKFDVSASNMIIFASIFNQAQVHGQWKRIRCSQLVQAQIA